LLLFCTRQPAWVSFASIRSRAICSGFWFCVAVGIALKRTLFLGEFIEESATIIHGQLIDSRIIIGRAAR
jgi:hypothetical protein